MTKQELAQYAKKAAQAPSCYPDLKKLIEDWGNSIGTASEQAAAQNMLAGLKECVSDIDGFINLATSKEGEKILGGKEAAETALNAAKKAKASGTKYCLCAACTNGGVLIDHEADILT